MPTDPSPVPTATSLRSRIRETLAAELDGAVLCGRVWEAWDYGTMTRDDFSMLTEDDETMDRIVDAVAGTISADPGPVAEEFRDLLSSLVDDDECWFDHHGGCQAHGYLSLGQGEKCPQAELKEVLAANGHRAQETSVP